MKKKALDIIDKLGEADYPIARDLRPRGNNKSITAKEIYNKKIKLPPSLGYDKPDFDLITERLEKKYLDNKLTDIYTIDGTLTVEDQMGEMRNRTSKGYELMLAEHKLMKYLLELK